MTFPRPILVAVWLFVFLAPGTASAEATGDDVFPLRGDPTLDVLVAEAIASSPELRAAEEGLAAESARVPQASALPDPTIGIGYSYGGRGLSPGTDDDTGVLLSFSQALPGGGKRALAGRVQTAEAARAKAAVARARLALVYGLRFAYAKLLLARENLALVEDQRRATADIEELTRSRYAVGLAGQSDVLRAQAELARFEQMRRHEQGEEASAIAEINRLLARPAESPVPATVRLSAVALLPLRIPTVAEAVDRVASAAPDVASARLLVDRSTAALDLARRNLRPDYMATATYLHRGSLPPMATVELGIALPIYKGRRQRPAIAEAEARLRAAEAAGGGCGRRPSSPRRGREEPRGVPRGRARGRGLHERRPLRGRARRRVSPRELQGRQDAVRHRARGPQHALPRPLAARGAALPRAVARGAARRAGRGGVRRRP